MAVTQRRSVRTRERASDALVRCGPEDLTRARASRDLLLASARVLVGLLDHEPDGAHGADAGCATAGDAGGGWCSLVHRLANVESSHEIGPASSPGTVQLEAAIQHFVAALTDAVDAVRRCRQTEHGAGHCWFTSLPDVDGCSDVLRAAHQLG